MDVAAAVATAAATGSRSGAGSTDRAGNAAVGSVDARVDSATGSRPLFPVTRRRTRMNTDTPHQSQ